MKSYILLFVLASFFLGSQLSAQTASLENAKVSKKTSNQALADLAVLAQEHNRIAVQQITDHLNTNILYPKEMESYALDGTLKLQVTLNRRGEIRNIKVLSTELPEAFSETAIKIMSQLKALRLTEGAYYGKTTFNVPMHFSL